MRTEAINAIGRNSNWLPHAVLWLGVLITAFPLYITFVASTLLPQDIAQVPMQMLPGPHFWDNYSEAWSKGATGTYLSPPGKTLLFNSLIVALVVTFGKISVSLLSAYAVVFFKFPGRMIFFWMIFITLMLPVEVRILPTYSVVTDLHLINSYAGLTLPIIASATATLLFRQFFMTIPDELVEAAKIDGAGAMRFFKDVVIPAVNEENHEQRRDVGARQRNHHVFEESHRARAVNFCGLDQFIGDGHEELAEQQRRGRRRDNRQRQTGVAVD